MKIFVWGDSDSWILAIAAETEEEARAHAKELHDRDHCLYQEWWAEETARRARQNRELGDRYPPDPEVIARHSKERRAAEEKLREIRYESLVVPDHPAERVIEAGPAIVVEMYGE